jgi:hypothetical protein
MERQRLPFAVVRNLWQVLVYQFDGATVESVPSPATVTSTARPP